MKKYAADCKYLTRYLSIVLPYRYSGAEVVDLIFDIMASWYFHKAYD